MSKTRETDLEKDKPLLQLLYWKHLHSNEAHALNDGDDCCRAVIWVPDLKEESAPDGMESRLTQNTNDLCVKVRNLPHVSHIWAGEGPACGWSEKVVL